MKFDLEYLEKLAKLMNDSELTEMQLEDQEQSIVLKREKQTVTAQQKFFKNYCQTILKMIKCK